LVCEQCKSLKEQQEASELEALFAEQARTHTDERAAWETQVKEMLAAQVPEARICQVMREACFEMPGASAGQMVPLRNNIKYVTGIPHPGNMKREAGLHPEKKTGGGSYVGPYLNEFSQPHIRTSLLFRLLPELFPHVKLPLPPQLGPFGAGPDSHQFNPTNPPWSDDAIALWFARASKAPPEQLIGAINRRGGCRDEQGWRHKYYQGWVFLFGSTYEERPLEPYGGPTRYETWPIGVSTDGQRLFYRYDGSSYCFGTEPVAYQPSWSKVRKDRFNGVALGIMAELARLPVFPPDRLSLPPPSYSPGAGWIDVAGGVERRYR